MCKCKYNEINIKKASFDDTIKQKDGNFNIYKFQNHSKGFKKYIKLIVKESITIIETAGT